MNETSRFNFNFFNKYRRQYQYKILNRVQGNRPQINLILLLLTVLTTYLMNGILYSFSIIAILLSHEMGHYLMCRKYGIDATLPYFIPLPLPPFGTMGAFIKMKSPIPDKRALFDVGVAGPLAGFIVTIPILIIGLQNSTFIPKPETELTGFYLGESFLFSKLAALIMGTEPQGFDTLLHPMAYAGWAGLFVTALNLLPIGQLDGGHVLYSLYGQKSQDIYKLTLAAFMIICAIWYPGWLLFILLLLFFGFKHPPPLNDYVPLDPKRKLIAYITMIIFIISFIPVPFHIN